MISVDAALELIYKSLKVLDGEILNVWEAYGRVITDDIYSYCDLPPFRASIKDGYAVIASDGKGRRRVLGGAEAGQTVSSLDKSFKLFRLITPIKFDNIQPGSLQLVPGTCVRVNTGAPIPNGNAAVIPSILYN